MKVEPSPELTELFDGLAAHFGGRASRIITRRICDHCETEEGFPCSARDRYGREWGDLCGECYSKLGCEVEE